MKVKNILSFSFNFYEPNYIDNSKLRSVYFEQANRQSTINYTFREEYKIFENDHPKKRKARPIYTKHPVHIYLNKTFLIPV